MGSIRPEKDTVEAKPVERHYLDFLEKQIGLNVRGIDWSNLLQKQLNTLEHYVDVELIMLSISDKGRCFMGYVDADKSLMYFEGQ